MMGLISRTWDRFRGTGEAAVTIPPMDGVFRPNQLLEEAPAVLSVSRPDNLAWDGSRVLFSSGHALFAFDPENPADSLTSVEEFDSDISCLAVSLGGTLAIGLASGAVLVRPRQAEAYSFTELGGQALTCPVAATFGDDDRLYLCLGSRHTSPGDWQRDLMSRNASGSVWEVDIASGRSRCLVDRLAYPCGIIVDHHGNLVVSEAWAHRLLSLSTDGVREVILDDLAGYPGRLFSTGRDDGFGLAIFAPRRQLVEFVLRERVYCEQMMNELEPDHWLAPSLHPQRDHLEALQLGCIRHLGELKPWSPSRSWGLVATLDRHGRPLRSYHSRADGTRHGITSGVAVANRLFVSSKGGDCIVELALNAGEMP